MLKRNRILSPGLEDNQLFWHFSNITIYIRVVGKMLHQHFNVLLFSNPGYKVRKDGKLQDRSVPYI